MLLLKDLPITCIDISKLYYNCYDSMSYSLRDILNSLYSQLFHIKEYLLIKYFILYSPHQSTLFPFVIHNCNSNTGNGSYNIL